MSYSKKVEANNEFVLFGRKVTKKMIAKCTASRMGTRFAKTYKPLKKEK